MLYTPLKSNIYLSGMSYISCKEIAFLALPLDSVGGSWRGGGAYSTPPNPLAVLTSFRSLHSGFFAMLRRSSLFFINFCSHA